MVYILAGFPNFSFSGESDRDVFNEKPSREEILAATQASDVLGACSSDFILKLLG